MSSGRTQAPEEETALPEQEKRTPVSLERRGRTDSGEGAVGVPGRESRPAR